jgi:hypothetical protein
MKTLKGNEWVAAIIKEIADGIAEARRRGADCGNADIEINNTGDVCGDGELLVTGIDGVTRITIHNIEPHKSIDEISRANGVMWAQMRHIEIMMHELNDDQHVRCQNQIDLYLNGMVANEVTAELERQKALHVEARRVIDEVEGIKRKASAFIFPPRGEKKGVTAEQSGNPPPPPTKESSLPNHKGGTYEL